MGGAEAEAPHLKGGAIVTVMITVVAAAAAVGGVEAAGMTGMMMEEDAGMVAHPQGVGGAQSGRAARNAGPRLSSGTVNARQSSEVPVASASRRALLAGFLACRLQLCSKWTCVG